MQRIQKFFQSYATDSCSWDNTGILIKPHIMNDERPILVTIDLTTKVLEEALELNVGSIIAYHPVIFPSISSITDEKLLKLIRAGVGVYCPHTGLDIKMNQTMGKILTGRDSIIDNEKIGMFSVSENLSNNTFKSIIEKLKSKIFFPTKSVSLQKSLPVNFQDYKNVRIRNIVCSVGSVQKECIDYLANENESEDSYDLLVTGEIRHHDLLKLQNFNVIVIVMNHSNSERFFLNIMVDDMKTSGIFSQHKMILSMNDEDPLSIVD